MKRRSVWWIPYHPPSKGRGWAGVEGTSPWVRNSSSPDARRGQFQNRGYSGSSQAETAALASGGRMAGRLVLGVCFTCDSHWPDIRLWPNSLKGSPKATDGCPKTLTLSTALPAHFAKLKDASSLPRRARKSSPMPLPRRRRPYSAKPASRRKLPSNSRIPSSRRAHCSFRT